MSNVSSEDLEADSRAYFLLMSQSKAAHSSQLQ